MCGKKGKNCPNMFFSTERTRGMVAAHGPEVAENVCMLSHELSDFSKCIKMEARQLTAVVLCCVVSFEFC